jgi:Protein of unknown function (DUF2585)
MREINTIRRDSGAMGIADSHRIAITALFATAVAAELIMHRPLICACGSVKLWEGVVNGPGNSQHIADWYSFSHVIHGILFFGVSWLALRCYPLGVRLVAATLVELGWELLENSPVIINRYRSATAAVGYSGDSILNSMCDGGWMIAGFLLASRLRWQASVAVVVVFELFTLAMIRDNLTLNILMLVYPIDAIRVWQSAV